MCGNGRSQARPTTHPPDRTAARFLDGKGISFEVRRVMTAVGLRGAGHRFGCGAGFTRRLVSEWFGVRRGRFARLSSGRPARPSRPSNMPLPVKYWRLI
jgi:hypothetical protein